MFAKSLLQVISATIMLASAAHAISNTVYVISNAETPSLHLPGLTPVGYDRAANCIPPIFANLDIGLILTCPFDPESNLCASTEATVAPVATALGLTPDTSCGVGEEADDDCLIDRLEAYAQTSTQAILIVWDWNEMDDVFENLDVDDDFEWEHQGHEDDDHDDDETPHFDLIATVVEERVTSLTSMACPDIDGQAPGSLSRRTVAGKVPNAFCSFFQAIAATVIMAGVAQAFNNTLYIISNAETPSLSLPGLTPVGKQRAYTCAPALFAPLNIGLLVTCELDPESGLCAATVLTATPIANALNLTADTSWQDLNGMDDLFEVMDIETPDVDDDDVVEDDTPHFDIVTTVVDSLVTNVASMNCAGLDGQAPGTFNDNCPASTPNPIMLGKSFLQAITATVMFAGAARAVFNNTIYVITNAETPSLNLPGLTPIGFQRASTCIPSVFSNLNVGLIVTCPFDADSGLCSETEATVAPVAAALGLTPDISCGAGEETDDDCVIDLMKKFGKTSTQSILLAWDLNGMDDLFENLDVDDDFVGPNGEDDDEDSDDETPHFDIIFTIVKGKVTNLASMGCPGIDGQAPGTFRRRSLKNMFQKKRAFNSRITRGIKA
ncbi:hypothetical protein CVT24_013055 [Panaeolus cyanescens]|uniref:Uncharacterized protein n=1 Tax=Panaeolus cyanescens TaxID=181874 RepID=A0A409YUV8_9AGAR|nr:hypothetical protein CVT24_013055 [Panaeolus cyanescens]